MTYQQFEQLFTGILTSDEPPAPYNNPDYLNYTKMNHFRMNRWVKTLQLEEDVKAALHKINRKQHWIIIVEPWCGDVSHSLPVMLKMVDESPYISYELQLRDNEPFLINSYLTNGSKAIPKLVARDENNADIFTWGARPVAAQQLMDTLKATGIDFENTKIKLQQWYNEDKGISVQREILDLLQLSNSIDSKANAA